MENEETDAPESIGRERPILTHGIGRRIDAAAKLIGGRESAAKAAGISTDSLGYYVKETAEPRLKNMAMLAKAAGVSLDWLAFGESPSGIREPGQHYGAPSMEEEFALVPLYSARASAGNGALVDDERITAKLAFRREWMRQAGISERQTALLQVEGDSMEPTIPAGATVLVDAREAARQATREGIYIIGMDGALMVKRIQRLPGNKLRITSDNPAYTPFELDVTAPQPKSDIIGRVIWVGHMV